MSEHQLSEGQIPSSLISTYVQYKKDTGAVIAWLVSHGTVKYKRLTALSIQDLLSLAEIVKMKAVEMPGTINFQFREAIAARTSLSKWYRKVYDVYESDDRDTCNHEHFTTCLSQIYNDLCRCCAKPKDRCTRGQRRNKSDANHSSPPNRFATLELDRDKHVQRSHCYEMLDMERDGKIECPKTPPLRLLDDSLSEAFELRKEIQDMHDLLIATKHVWNESALKRTSVLVATFVTHLAFAEFEQIEDRLRTSCSVEDPGTLWSKYVEMENFMQTKGEMEEDVSLQSDEESELQYCAKTMIEDMKEFWRVIDQVKLEGIAALCKQQSKYSTLRGGLRKSPNDRKSVATISKAIGYHLAEGSYDNTIIRHGSPVNDDICRFLTSQEGTDRNSLRCSFGLHLLLQSNKSSLFASQSSSLHAASRLQALKFAQQGIASIKAALEASAFACRCPRTIAAHLHRLLEDLEMFIKMKVFDLYFRSPWVSGSHILEMLDSLFRAGMRMFNYQNYACSVLHAYNVLRQLHHLAAIPILDKLIESGLSEIIFPGGRPERNFKASYGRSLGGRLHFGHSRQRSQHQSGCHSMCVPAHVGMVTRGVIEPSCEGDTDHRFDIEKISLLHFVKSRGYHPTKANLARVSKVDGVKPEQQVEPKALQSVTKSRCSHTTHARDDTICPNQRLQDFGKAIHAELTGSFPVARINYFSVYLACVRIVSAISDKHHAGIDSKAVRGGKCVCFTDVLMGAADRCVEYEKCPFGYKGLVEICQKAIEDELSGKDLEDFLWKDL